MQIENVYSDLSLSINKKSLEEFEQKYKKAIDNIQNKIGSFLQKPLKGIKEEANSFLESINNMAIDFSKMEKAVPINGVSDILSNLGEKAKDSYSSMLKGIEGNLSETLGVDISFNQLKKIDTTKILSEAKEGLHNIVGSLESKAKDSYSSMLKGIEGNLSETLGLEISLDKLTNIDTTKILSKAKEGLNNIVGSLESRAKDSYSSMLKGIEGNLSETLGVDISFNQLKKIDTTKILSEAKEGLHNIVGSLESKAKDSYSSMLKGIEGSLSETLGVDISLDKLTKIDTTKILSESKKGLHNIVGSLESKAKDSYSSMLKGIEGKLSQSLGGLNLSQITNLDTKAIIEGFKGGISDIYNNFENLKGITTSIAKGLLNQGSNLVGGVISKGEDIKETAGAMIMGNHQGLQNEIVKNIFSTTEDKMNMLTQGGLRTKGLGVKSIASKLQERGGSVINNIANTGQSSNGFSYSSSSVSYYGERDNISSLLSKIERNSYIAMQSNVKMQEQIEDMINNMMQKQAWKAMGEEIAEALKSPEIWLKIANSFSMGLSNKEM